MRVAPYLPTCSDRDVEKFCSGLHPLLPSFKAFSCTAKGEIEKR
jgi:hypothetical protein